MVIKRNDLIDVLSLLGSGGLVPDDAFDLFFSPANRRLSSRHWTPVKVARRAAVHLAELPGTRVLDVGSGVGKFCIVGAVTTEGVFVGVEQRKHLIMEAEAVCNDFGIGRVVFHHGNMADLDWAEFDAFYLYNPFFENLVEFSSIDDSIPISFDLYYEYTALVKKKLRKLPLGTKVATYHGFGEKIPDCYEILVKERIGSGDLNIWVKTKDTIQLTEAELAEAELLFRGQLSER